jgi:4-amino-4-deoxy-L-arabinose transferase-like glycosyltransferase
VEPHRPLLRALLIGIIVLFYVLGAVLSQKRSFDPDEFMHLHFSWTIFKGLLPFRDYFDHYTPLYHLLLVPFFHFFQVDTNIRDSIAFLFFARKLAWVISGAVLLLTFWLGKLWRNTEVGIVAVVFLLTTEAYWNMTLEIRPDPLSTVFWLLFMIAVVRAVKGDHEETARRRWFAWSGLFLSLAFLTSQKYVYGFPGLVAGMCWYMWKPSGTGTRYDRFVQTTYQFIAFCVPLILTFAYFYFRNSLTQFIQYNFLFYLRVVGGSPYAILHQFLYQHPFLALLGGAGLLRSLAFVFGKSSPKSGDFMVVLVTLSLIGGLFIIPAPNYQYYVLFLPGFALLAAAFLLESAVKLSALRDRLTDWQWITVAALSSILILGGIVLIGRGAGSQRPLTFILGYWVIALSCFMALMFKRSATAALVLFFIAMSVGALIRMDGYRGSGVFRPHAYFFWFLALNERSGISENDRQQVLDDLRSGRIAPKLILLDNHLRDFSPGITEFFEINYEPTGTGVIWKRKSLSQASP